MLKPMLKLVINLMVKLVINLMVHLVVKPMVKLSVLLVSAQVLVSRANQR